MSQILASGKTGANKYDLKSNDPNKVLPRLDARQLAQSLQYAYEVGQGFSYSGDEGASGALDDDLSIIDTSNISTYSKDLSQLIQTFVSNNSRLLVDGASTANAITLNAPYITEEDAPDGNNYKKTVPLPFTYRDGLSFTFQATATNTEATTISIPGLAGLSGSIDVVGEDGNDLVGGEIIVNKFIEIVLSGTAGTKRAILKTAQSAIATTTTQGVSYLPKRITVSNGTDADHDIDFTAGVFQFDDGSGQAVANALTKQIDAAWVEGDNAGGLDTGSVATDTTYHMFAIYNPTTSTSDYLFSTSSSSPTMPSGYTKKKRVGSLITNASSNILVFTQSGKNFYLKNTVQDSLITYASSSYPTTSTLLNLTVPTGISVKAIINVDMQTQNNSVGAKAIYISSPYQNDITPSISSYSLFNASQGGNENENMATQLNVITNTNGAVRQRGNSANIGSSLLTSGWIDFDLD